MLTDSDKQLVRARVALLQHLLSNVKIDARRIKVPTPEATFAAVDTLLAGGGLLDELRCPETPPHGAHAYRAGWYDQLRSDPSLWWECAWWVLIADIAPIVGDRHGPAELGRERLGSVPGALFDWRESQLAPMDTERRPGREARDELQAILRAHLGADAA